MKQTTLTIRLDGELERMLARASRLLRRTRSEVVRDALRRQLRLLRFESVRARVTASAEARGFLTDEDILDRGR